jgi:hypothetical protein
MKVRSVGINEVHILRIVFCQIGPHVRRNSRRPEVGAMRVPMYLRCLMAMTIAAICTLPVSAQQRNGIIAGSVTDSARGALPGARVELQPNGQSVVSNGQGQFTLLDLAPGPYKLTVSYIGFAPFSTDVAVSAGGVAHVEAVLQIGMQNEAVTVRGGRERGEVEALNIERTADNVVQVLPAEVITSLPNTVTRGVVPSVFPASRSTPIKDA